VSEPGSSGCCRARPATRRRPSWATRSTTPTGATPSRPTWPSTSSCERGGRRCCGPIPDERLEADPLAELTVEEAAAAERGTPEAGEHAFGLVSAAHPFEVLADDDITPEEEQASEEDDDEPPPDPDLGIHIERHNQAR
jgi:hypothetical protein